MGRRLHNEEFHSLFRSPNIVRVIKSRILRWTANVTRMEGGRNFQNFNRKSYGKETFRKTLA